MKEELFVTEYILELLTSERISEKQEESHIVNPLSVAYRASGKKRLILDLSRVNKFVQRAHFRRDDWKVSLQFLSHKALLFTFDLKSGYHRIDFSQKNKNI